MKFSGNYTLGLDKWEKCAYNIHAFGVWRSLVSRLVRDQEASGSNPDTPTMQSVLIGSEYPVMDTLLFYVENGEKLELSMLTRSRRHSSLTLCSSMTASASVSAGPGEGCLGNVFLIICHLQTSFSSLIVIMQHSLRLLQKLIGIDT